MENKPPQIFSSHTKRENSFSETFTYQMHSDTCPRVHTLTFCACTCVICLCTNPNHRTAAPAPGSRTRVRSHVLPGVCEEHGHAHNPPTPQPPRNPIAVGGLLGGTGATRVRRRVHTLGDVCGCACTRVCALPACPRTAGCGTPRAGCGTPRVLTPAPPPRGCSRASARARPAAHDVTPAGPWRAAKVTSGAGRPPRDPAPIEKTAAAAARPDIRLRGRAVPSRAAPPGSASFYFLFFGFFVFFFCFAPRGPTEPW